MGGAGLAYGDVTPSRMMPGVGGERLKPATAH